MANDGHPSSSEDEFLTGDEEPGDESTPPRGSAKATAKSRARDLKQRLKQKSKAILDREESPEQDGHGTRDAANELHKSAAFSPQQLQTRQDRDSGIGGTLLNVTDKLQSATRTIRHPIHSSKQRVASRVAKSDQPDILHSIDSDLLDAHENLVQAQSSRNHSSEDDEEDLDKCVDKFEHITDQKKSLTVAWNTKRFVRRVRVVHRRPIDLPRWSRYREVDADGNPGRQQWEMWLGHLLLFLAADCGRKYTDDFEEPPFSRTALTRHVERLIVASAPWQAQLSSWRQIYRWEDKRRTGKWFAVFLALWLSNYVVSFLWFYGIFIVVRSRYSGTSVEALRESRNRTVSRGDHALKFTEFTKRHGSNDWIDPLIEDLGPILQLQLGDLADFLEVMINFYDWRDPQATAASLFFLVCCLAIGVFSSTNFAMRVITFVAIGSFFICRPVASLHPKYRHYVSPMKWAFWGIPTHAEWSFRYLQEQARAIFERSERPEEHVHSQGDDQIKHRGSVHFSKDGGDLLNGTTQPPPQQETLPVFRCRHQKSLGKLSILRGGMAFAGSLPQRVTWERSYLDVLEMRKFSRPGIAKIGKQRLLELTFVSGESLQLEVGKRRDELFNTIIGFSGLQWQQLQEKT